MRAPSGLCLIKHFGQIETVTEPASGGLNKGGTWCEPVLITLERGTIGPQFEDERDGE